MSREYAAADFITDVEEALNSGEVVSSGYKTLMRDMMDILDKVNENRNRPSLKIKISQSSGILGFSSSSYQRIYFEDSPAILLEQWLTDGGVVHREGNDLPARIFYNQDGTIESEEWLDHGVRKREGAKPAYIEYESKI